MRAKLNRDFTEFDLQIEKHRVVIPKGEEVTILVDKPYLDHDDGDSMLFICKAKDGSLYEIIFDWLTILPEEPNLINWEQRRYELTKEIFKAKLIAIESSDYEIEDEDLISDSIALADETIEQLINK